MKFKISELYIPHSDKIKYFITEFENTGTQLVSGKRNDIKIFELEGRKINIKSFKIPNPVNKIVYRFFRKSKAERSYFFASYLISKEIGTPYPIAYAENQSLLTFEDSYYVSEHLDYDITFRELITDPEYPEREKILREFTKFTYRLHENRILFKDHSPGNTLIKKTEEGYKFYLVDLNRMIFKALTFEERMRNFSRLTPKREMIEKMSETYAQLIGSDQKEVFEKMWKYTENFQQAYFRKKKIKKTVFFWKKN